MIVYYTGTGNSRYCAQAMAEKLGDELLDAHDYMKNGIAAELISAEPWVFCAPIYAWRMARVFEQFIRSGSFSGSRKAYFVLSCGSEIGNAGAFLEKLCAEVGLEYMGVLGVAMPENYVAMFSVPDEEKCRAMYAAAEKPLSEGAECVKRGEQFPARPVSGLDKAKSAINEGFYRFFVKADGFRTTDACVGCGACSEACPLNNITMKDARPVWGGSCTHCMACICGCPRAAIEYGKRSVGKRRYRCPEYGKE